MARRKREPMSEGKKNIIGMLLEEYDIKSAKDIEDALKDLLGGTIQEMLESELDEHLGYQEYERSGNPDSRNGKKTKKIRGVKDILVICADGLTGMKEAVSAAFPQTELQRCIVHQVRNTLKYVGEKNKKEFANDLKTIYHAPSEDAALEALDRVTEKWEDDYPNAMKSWYKNWDVISPIFKFSSDVRKVIYTTNAIESLNSGYRRLNKQRSVFPSDTALLKALYLATHEIAKKWTMPLRNWGKVLGELEIMYPDRIG